MLVQDKQSDTKGVLRLAQTKPQKLIEKLRPALNQLPLMLYPKRHRDIFSPDGPSNGLLLRRIRALKPDLVHVHWVNNGFLSVGDLAKLELPMMWSLHDANAYTGGCHIVAAACVGVSIGCRRCPLLKSHFPYDLSFWTFRAKKRAYKNLKVTINGLSRWIANCAKDSALLGDKKIINLPNPIDTNIYKPLDKGIARELLGLNSAAKIISFGALDTATPRKGYAHLIAALKTLKNRNIKLVVFGASGGENGANGENEAIEGFETLYLGRLSDDLSLRVVYSLSDVVIVPSLVESFGQIALEALSCGTPVVAFETSGLKDIIEHKKCGYLAKMPDSPPSASAKAQDAANPSNENGGENPADDLARGIAWVLDAPNYEELAQNAKHRAKKLFDARGVAARYKAAYETILRGGHEAGD